MSDGNILCQDSEPISSCNIGKQGPIDVTLHATTNKKGDAPGLSDSTPEISACGSDLSYSRSATLSFCKINSFFLLSLIYYAVISDLILMYAKQPPLLPTHTQKKNTTKKTSQQKPERGEKTQPLR